MDSLMQLEQASQLIAEKSQFISQLEGKLKAQEAALNDTTGSVARQIDEQQGLVAQLHSLEQTAVAVAVAVAVAEGQT